MAKKGDAERTVQIANLDQVEPLNAPSIVTDSEAHTVTLDSIRLSSVLSLGHARKYPLCTLMVGWTSDRAGTFGRGAPFGIKK